MSQILHITFGPDHHTEICGTVFDHTTCAHWKGQQSQAVELFGDQYSRIFTNKADFDFALPGLNFERYEPVTQEMLATIKDEAV